MYGLGEISDKIQILVTLGFKESGFSKTLTKVQIFWRSSRLFWNNYRLVFAKRKCLSRSLHFSVDQPLLQKLWEPTRREYLAENVPKLIFSK